MRRLPRPLEGIDDPECYDPQGDIAAALRSPLKALGVEVTEMGRDQFEAYVLAMASALTIVADERAEQFEEWLKRRGDDYMAELQEG